MHALSDYSQAVDHAGERAEALARAHDAAVDHVFIASKRNPAVRVEAWNSLLDSGNGPATNLAHERLIESIAGIDAELMCATDAESVRRRMLLLDAIFCTALDDVLITRAEQEVGA
jgi:hypothetical protein